MSGTHGSSSSNWLVYTVKEHLRALCLYTAECLTTAPGKVVYAIKKTGVIDALGDGPKSADQLAKELGLHEDSLYRVLRAAVNMNVLAVEGAQPPRFRNTDVTSLLLDSHPHKIWPTVQWTVDDGYATMGEMEWVVRTGGNAFRKTHNGDSLWELLKTDPKRAEDFSRAMVGMDGMTTLEGVVLDYPWNRYGRFVEIAGMYGSFLARLLRRVKKAEGVLVDQPEVIAISRKMWSEEADKAELNKRVSFVEGDFFKSETLPKPRANDAWVMRNILHDYNDDDAVRILAAVRTAVGTTPVTLCLCEFTFVDEFADIRNLEKCGADLMVLTMLGAGRERTRPEWEKLFASGGFKLNRIVETRGPLCVVEAVPV
ncbi:hypothetical protein WJX81_004798 [Elliptochloris bilobata]|uniref:O-methyltransferase domain-containing protein n=1 Tax=Elliptochloris bilobata TaxID=381761 RepID=A0AAW1QM36_9CHLO